MASKRKPGSAVRTSPGQVQQSLQRLPTQKQKRLDVLMGKNNRGSLSDTEREELQGLVREAEEITLENARQLTE
jgi:hypothetical protein